MNLAFLTGGPRDAPERHRALHATIDASYAPLDSDQRIAVKRMATFAGPVGIDAALAVTGADLSTIEALVDRHLLIRREDGIGMLETIRESERSGRSRTSTPKRTGGSQTRSPLIATALQPPSAPPRAGRVR